MSRSFTAVPVLFAAVLAFASAGTATSARASEEAPTAGEVEAARRCAIDTRLAGHAFGEVRDSVRAGGTTRAEALLAVAEDALMEARSSCRGNYEVSSQLEMLAGEVEGLHGSLGAAR